MIYANSDFTTIHLVGSTETLSEEISHIIRSLHEVIKNETDEETANRFIAEIGRNALSDKCAGMIVNDERS